MAHYIFVVNVRTDDKHADAPSADNIRNEILSNLQFDSPGNGIERVTCRQVHSVGGMTEAMRGDSDEPSNR